MSTGSFPALKRLAEELIEKLTSLESYEAALVRQDLYEVSLRLGSMSEDSDHEDILDRIVALNRRAYALLGRSPLPPQATKETITLRPPRISPSGTFMLDLPPDMKKGDR